MVVVRKVVYPKQVFKKINFHTKKVKTIIGIFLVF
jgi:hypothetical protein